MIFKSVYEAVSFLGDLCLNVLDGLKDNWFGLGDGFGSDFMFALRALSIEIVDVE